MNPKNLAILLAGLAIPAANANTLLWSDNFNAADTTNFDGAPLTGRLTGSLAPTVRLAASRTQQHILGNQLRMINAGSGRARFQKIVEGTWCNWASGTEGAAILADGGMRVEFDFTSTDVTSDNWVSFNIGPEVLKTVPERFNAVLHILLDVAMQASGADMGSIMFKDKGTDNLTIRVASNLSEDVIRSAQAVYGEGIAGTVMKEKAPILIDDTNPDNRVARYLSRPYLKSSMVLPIMADDKAVGVMNLGALEESSVRFSNENLERMTSLINIATDVLYSPVKQYIGTKSAYFDQVL